MYTVVLKKNEEKNILKGFPWVYANEVSKIEGKDKQGSVAKVVSYDGRFVGLGYINHLSKIIVRILTLKEEPIDKDFFFRRISFAADYRKELGYDDNYRVVFGESDFLPGLIVDKYGDYLSVQFLTLGMDVCKAEIIEILVELFSPKGIYERDDVAVREKEGLKQFKGVVYGKVDGDVCIIENGLKMFVDIENGQKTGYFLDQKENRDILKHYVKNKDVLDCFCNVGGFSLCAAKYGAKSVTAVDISSSALEIVRKNAELNDLKIDTVQGDVFEVLRDYKKDRKQFGVVVLDPPAFTKSADTVKSAYVGYKDINIQALKLVENGGYLITCSCSQHMTPSLFMNMLSESIYESKVKAKLVEMRYQGKDHATLFGTEQSLYLKVAVIKVLKEI